MKISVVMSTYKRPLRVKKAIESVLAQTYPDFELIVVDDCSKDTTKDVVGAFSDPRITYICLEKNSGSDTKPKNTGILASKGEYIAFLDDDNVYRPDHLAILLKELEKDERIDVVYGDRWLVDETGQVKDQIGIAYDFNPTLLMERNYIDSSDTLGRRQAFFDVGGFDETCNKYVDWNVWVRMLKMGKNFKRVPLIVSDYHCHMDMKSMRVKTKYDDYDKFVPEWSPYDCEIVLPYLGTKITPPKVAVYSITYDRLEYTKQSFKSLADTAGYPFDHYVVDNGSTDGTKDWLSGTYEIDDPNVHYCISNKTNFGISKASNQAIEEIKKRGNYDIIVKWDNDCIGLTKGWLAKMVDIWHSNRRMAMACYVQGLVDNPGGAPRLMYGTLKGEFMGMTKHLGGICHFVDAHAYDKFRWDEESFLHGVQDTEFSQYLQYHGYLMGYLENYYVSHGPQGSKQQKVDYPEYFERRIKEKQTRYEKT